MRYETMRTKASDSQLDQQHGTKDGKKKEKNQKQEPMSSSSEETVWVITGRGVSPVERKRSRCEGFQQSPLFAMDKHAVYRESRRSL